VLLVSTIKIRPNINTKNLSISHVVADPVIGLSIVGNAALDAAIYYVCHETETGCSVCGNVGSCWAVPAHHHIVAGRLGTLLSHPKPQRRLEGDDGVVGDQLGVPKPVEAQGLACWPIIVIPRELDWTSAVICLARVAWPLCVSAVTTVTLWFYFFLQVQSPYVRSIRCVSPAPCCLMRDLSEEGGDFTFACGQVAGSSKLRETFGGLNEGRIVVETICGAIVIVFVQEKRVVEVLCYYG
jgi:hypothetical protein